MFQMADKIKSTKNGKIYTVQWATREWVKVAESARQMEISVHKFVRVEG